MSSAPGEIDDGDYATLRGPTGDLLHYHGLNLQCDTADDTSEEGKLLESVRDDSVTYASTRDLEPPMPSQHEPLMEIPDQLLSPIAPVMVTVHTNDLHVRPILEMCLQSIDDFKLDSPHSICRRFPTR